MTDTAALLDAMRTTEARPYAVVIGPDSRDALMRMPGKTYPNPTGASALMGVHLDVFDDVPEREFVLFRTAEAHHAYLDARRDCADSWCVQQGIASLHQVALVMARFAGKAHGLPYLSA